MPDGKFTVWLVTLVPWFDGVLVAATVGNATFYSMIKISSKPDEQVRHVAKDNCGLAKGGRRRLPRRQLSISDTSLI